MQNEMGYRWGQLERFVARAFQNGALNMHGWACIESWLQSDLVTTDIPFLSQAPIIRLISAARVQTGSVHCAVFIAGRCLAPQAALWPGSRPNHYTASPLEVCSVYWCRLGRGLIHHLGWLPCFHSTVNPDKCSQLQKSTPTPLYSTLCNFFSHTLYLFLFCVCFLHFVHITW